MSLNIFIKRSIRISVVAAAFFVLFLIFCIAMPAHAKKTFQESTVSGIEIKVSGMVTDSRMWETIARDLIQFSPGDGYSPRLVEEAVTRLVDSGVFQSIHVPDPVQKEGQIFIVFQVIPRGRIKEISVKKAFPMFTREVLNVMTLFTGDAFSREKLADQAHRIELLFEKQGFFDPKVKVTARKDKADGNYSIDVVVEKGDFFKVSDVRFQGNHQVSSSRLKLRLKTWRSSVLFGSAQRFIQREMEADVKTLKAFYRQKGFADVSVKTDVLKDPNQDQKKVSLVFHIIEGPRYQIDFAGNDNLWDRTLKKEVTLYRDGNKNNFGLRKSVRSLKQLYGEKGFANVKIQSKTDDQVNGDKREKQVILDIKEGLQYRVSKITILGNHTIPEKEIRDAMLTIEPSFMGKGIYVPKVLKGDINAIRALYLREGFAAAQVDKTIEFINPEKKKVDSKGIQQVDSSGMQQADSKGIQQVDSKGMQQVDIRLNIDEGVQTLVESVQFTGLAVFSGAQALDMIALRSGEPFRPYMVENDEKNLQQAISELGYPRASVKAKKKFSRDNTGVSLVYGVDQGSFVRVGQVYYMGNFRTKKLVLDSEMTLVPGESLSLRKLLESRKNLLDMTALHSARITPVGLDSQGDEVDLIVEVEEGKPYFFDLGAGYDTERHFYVNSEVGDKNFFGRNLGLSLEGEVSQIGYKAELAMTNPRFFSTRIKSTTRFFGEEREEFNKDFGTRSQGISQKLYQSYFSDKLVANIGLMYENREKYLTESRILDPDEVEEYTPRHVLVASPGILFKTTDSYVKPTKGLFSTLDLDISKGIDSNLDDFFKYRLDLRYYYSLLDPLVIAVRGRYGFIQPYGSNERVPEDQLFFLGGTSSVRGFEENLLRMGVDEKAVGGRESILGSVEARYDLGLNFEVTAFYDVGAVRRAQTQGGSDDFRNSVGLGLRYMTPVGPIGLLYGWKLDPLPNESSGSIHFSMGYTF